MLDSVMGICGTDVWGQSGCGVRGGLSMPNFLSCVNNRSSAGNSQARTTVTRKNYSVRGIVLRSKLVQYPTTQNRNSLASRS